MKVERSETFVEQSDIARNASIFTYLTSFLYVVCGGKYLVSIMQLSGTK